MTKKEHSTIINILSGNPWDVTKKLSAFMDTVEVDESDKSQRTPKQNSSLHLYLSQVAQALDREGHTMQDVVQAIRKAEIRPTMNAIKEVVWKPLQLIILGKESTTELSTDDIDKVYDPFNKWLGTEFGIHIPFPNEAERSLDKYYTQTDILPRF